MEGKRLEEPKLRCEWAELEIARHCCVSDAVTLSGHIGKATSALQQREARPDDRDVLRRPESWNGNPPLGLEVLHMCLCKHTSGQRANVLEPLASVPYVSHHLEREPTADGREDARLGSTHTHHRGWRQTVSEK